MNTIHHSRTSRRSLSSDLRPLSSGHSPRRGVVLLIVVSLLALFVLLGVTFTLVALQALNASKLDARNQQYGDPPEVETDQVLGQILFDTQARTVLQYHSLLRDLYGDDRLTGTVTANPAVTGTPNTGKQFFTLQFTPLLGTLSAVPNYYAGRVITFQTGPAANHSTRIVGCSFIAPAIDSSVGLPQLIIEAIESKLSGSLVPTIGDQFVINGAPFNGTGAGYDSYTCGLDALLVNSASGGGLDSIALLPNYASYDAKLTSIVMNANTSPVPSPANYIATLPNGSALPGGLDESWDAVDFQNMFLAMVPPRAAENYILGNPTSLMTAYMPIIPSFHRPELVNYWLNGPNGLIQLMVNKNVTQPQDQATCLLTPYGQDRIRGTQDDPVQINGSNIQLVDLDRINNVLRGCMMRPMPWDHPNFTGSNIAAGTGVNVLYSMAQIPPATNLYPWDVDNDNDGLPDSIWIDPGLPIVTTPDGKRYKRLAAILIKDLDGSINLNAHGNIAQPMNNAYQAMQQTTVQLGLAAAGQYINRGMGFGPADVNFMNVLPNGGASAYLALVQGRYSSNLLNTSGTPIDTFFYNPNSLPVGNDLARPGVPQVISPLTLLKHSGVPDDFTKVNNNPPQPTWYASPPDVWGRGAVVLDYSGQPFFSYLAQGPFASGSYTGGEMLDSPYELSLNGEENGSDSPYTVAELESILRYHDPDSTQLYSRPLLYARADLAYESPGFITPGGSHSRRNMLTTISSDVPVPQTALYPEVRQALVTGGSSIKPGSATILDLYQYKTNNNIQVLQQIVPWEFFKGQKFDINRWLGDGFDNDGDGVRDDASDALVTGAGAEYGWQGTTLNMPPQGSTQTNMLPPPAFQKIIPQHHNGIDINQDGSVNNTDKQFAKQLYARHLYCLMMLLVNNNANNNTSSPSKWVPLFDADGDGNPSTPGNPGTQFDTARIVAQWAVNVVDFRDTDSIMTRFDYDPNVFTSGWSTWNPTAFVWGVERPELLITETLAFHDRRTEDLGTEGQNPNNAGDVPAKTTDPAPTPPDTDYDQRLMPRGTAFIELYNPWYDSTNGSFQPPPAELYTKISGVAGVELDRMAGSGASAVPVWRLLIIQGTTHLAIQTSAAGSGGGSGGGGSGGGSGGPGNASGGGTVPFNPDTPKPNSSLLATPTDVERAIFFADPSNIVTQDPLLMGGCVSFNTSLGKSVSNPSKLSLLAPGQYAVVGSSGITATSMSTTTYTSYIGRLTSDGNDMANKATTRQIVLTPGLQRNSGTLTTSEVQVLNNSAAPASNDNPAQLGLTRAPIGIPIDTPRSFNITEPKNGYPTATFVPPVAPDVDGTYSPPYDVPLDDPINRPDLVAGSGWNPAVDASFPNYRTVLLQRLADPTQTWNANTNPYITVDRSSIDVTAFNGVATDQSPQNPAANRYLSFQTFERGGSNKIYSNLGYDWPEATTDLVRTLWAMASPRLAIPTTTKASVPTETTVGPHYFPYQLYHSLGFLNTRYSPRLTSGNFAGLPDPTVAPPPGTTPMTFPWLTFNNRPFMNPAELMLVPAMNQYGLLSTFQSNASVNPAGTEYQTFGAPFPQLLNFFQANPTGGTPGGPHFCRLFDYVETPSPFTGAERWYNATQFGSITPPASGFYYFPPFNKISRFRDPGRVNINTIFDYQVWDAVVSQFPGISFPTSQTFFNTVAQSRRGASTAGYWHDMDTGGSAPLLPTRFANPYRSADSADLMPNVGTGQYAMRKTNPVEATLLRPSPTSATSQPLLATPMTDNFRDGNRNPYFRYQAYEKLSNILTTHSNCFAVWITIGYFEVEEFRPTGAGIVFDSAHPDGYALAQELGIDTGEVTRHRSFFIIDRSVPVGFVPGSKLNTDDCVLVKRLIE